MTALAEAHIRAEERIRVAAATGIERAWAALPAYNEENIPDFLRVALPLILAAQRASAQITAAYLARAGGTAPIALDLAAVTGAGPRAGVAPAEVYRRPFVTTWTALGNGVAYDDAVTAGRSRASSTAAMDVQLAMTNTVAEVSRRDPRIVGFERIPNSGACDLCLIASTQRYRAGDLMPIHNHCGCGVAPIYGDTDPGQVINRDRYAELKDSGAIDRITAQRERAREAGVEVDVHEHGEVGPVLTPAGQAFTQL